MDYQASAWQRWRLGTIALLLFGLACADTAGDGCGGCGLGETVPYDPNGPIIEHAVQVRLSQHGLGWLEDNAGPLVGGLIGDGGLSFCVEPQSVDLGIGDYEICNDADVNMCDAETPGCLFDPEIAGMELVPTDGGGSASDSLEVTVFLDLDEDISTSTCPGLRVYSPSLPVSLEVVFHVNGPSDRGEEGRTWIEVTNIDVDFSAVSAEASSFVTNPLDQISCGTLALAVSGLGTTVGPLLTDPIEATVADALCTPCGAEGACPGDAYCGGDPEVCRWDVAGSPCVPLALGTEGELPLGALLADFAPHLENDLSYLAYAADFADAENGGMTLAAEVGVYSPHDLCVPDLPSPATTPIPHSAGLVSDQTPLGEPFMFGIGVGKRAIDLALWSAYRSGALCLAVGSETVEQLMSGALAVFVPGLNALTEGQSVPVILVTRPTEPPTVNLGSGAREPGAEVPADPALAIEAENFKLDFYFFIEERFARVFTLDTDFSLPIVLEPSDDGSGIQIVLTGDVLSGLFTRVEAENAELLSEEDLDALVELLPGLIGVAAGPLQDAVGDPFALPELGGYRLALDENSFTSIDDETMLAIFADLEAAPAGGTTTAGFAPSAVAELASLRQPTADEIAAFEAVRDRGGVVEPSALQSELLLRVDTLGARPDEEREYAYRIDGGLWRGYVRPEEGVLRLRDPELLLEGTRTFEVRSRIVDQPGTLSLISAPVSITIDLASPEALVERLDDEHVVVRAWDSVSASADLTIWYRIDDGDWSEATVESPIALPMDRDAVDLEVQVEDEAGRTRYVTRTFAIHGRTTNTDTGGGDSCGGCSSTGAGSGTWWWLLLGLLVVRRRAGGRGEGEGQGRRGRRLLRLLGVSALLAALIGSAGCKDDPPPANNQVEVDECDNACEDDETCQDGVCVSGGCTIDDDCDEGQVCEGSTCVIGDSCEADVDCPAGMFCLDGDDDGYAECVSVPCEGNAACSDLSCGGGRLPYCIADSCMCEFPCADGCGEDEYCCNARNSCEEVPNVCAPLDCEVGFGPAVVVPAGGDPTSCQVTGPECECRELPPLPMGDIGSFMGADAADDGTIYISAFNRTYDDLMVGAVGDDGAVAWEFVDGLPETGAVTGSLNGPRGGIAEGGPRVGRYSDLAVGSDGALHVSYYDGLTRTLRYAHGEPAGGGFDWTFQVVDETPRTGTYTSITVSDAGVPAIAYFAERIEGEPGVWSSQVRVAWADAAEPEVWTIEVASDVPTTFPCGGLCTGSTRCHAEANRCETIGRDSECEPECSGDLVCFEGPDGNRCGTRASDIPAVVLLPEGSGIFVDSTRTPDGEIALAWYDRARGNLMFSQSVGGTFAEVAPRLVDGELPDGDDADSEPDDTGDVGWYPNVVVDASGAAHLTYVDATHDWLLYLDLSDESGRHEIVDNGVRGFGETSGRVLVGDDSSMLVLDDGTVQVAYQDATQHQIVLRQRTPAGSWVAPEVIAGDEDPYEGSVGFYLQQIDTGSGTYVLTYRIHTAEGVRDVVALPLD